LITFPRNLCRLPRKCSPSNETDLPKIAHGAGVVQARELNTLAEQLEAAGSLQF